MGRTDVPLLHRPLLAITVLVYLLITLLIGVWALRRTRTPRDFWVAGQGMGVLMAGIVTMAAAFSGFVFLGGPGLTYRIGVGSLFINLPIGFTSALLGWAVAKRLRLLAEVREVYTIPDALLCRFGSRVTSGTAAAAILVGTVSYLGTQLLALGRLLESVLGLRETAGPHSLAVGIAIGLAVLLFYSVGGGMVAGVYTDLFQGTLMILSACAVFGVALKAGGGLSGIAASIAGSPRFGRQLLEPFGRTPVLTALGFYFVFGIGVLGQPQMLHKFLMLKDPRRLRWLPLTLGLSQILCLLIWLGVGLAVPALVAQGRLPVLTQPDDAAPLFLLHIAPEMVTGLAVAGILSAIMSTADGFMNIGSAVLVRDLPKTWGRRVRRELLWGRIATVLVTLAAAGLAFVYNDLIALLGTFAFGTFGAALAPALAVGLNWKRVTATAATASIATGTLLNLFLEFLGKQTFFPSLPRLLPPGALPAAVSLAASFTVLLAMTAWGGSRRRDEALPEDVAAVLEV
jgi:Na+/proline symporter